jgi:nicotinate-nucleotide adenylyltransferase
VSNNSRHLNTKCAATDRSGRKSVPTLPSFGDRQCRRIGILGGSYNPAHAGHLHISREALKRLNLDQVWWLVSPQNPLKSSEGMTPIAQRFAAAKTIAKREPRILVTDIEARLGSTRTAQTMQKLCLRYPNLDFVWLMGADNLAEISRWWQWARIFQSVRVAVFDRSPYSHSALASKASHRFASFRTGSPSHIWLHPPPCWTYIAIRRHPASATAARAKVVS